MKFRIKDSMYHHAAKAYIDNQSKSKYLKEMVGKGHSLEISMDLWNAIDIYEYTKLIHEEDPCGVDTNADSN